MKKAFDRIIKQVKIRHNLNLIVEICGLVICAAGAVGIVAVLVEKLFAVDVILSQSLWAFLVVNVAAILILWWRKYPRSMEVALLVDERLELKERFSSTLAFEQVENDPFAQAAQIEARKRAEKLDIKGKFPIQAGRRWYYAAGAWIIAGALLFLPQQDLLGFLKEKEEEEKKTQQLQETKTEIKKTTQPVKLAIKQVDAKLSEELAELDQMPAGATPAEIKQQTIKKLTNLSDALKQMQSNMKMESLEQMQQMLKQLRGSPEKFSQELRQALAQGKFDQASKMIEQLQQKLQNSKLSDKDKSDISRQLQELSKQMKELAEKNKELQKALQKEGLDKELAKLNEEQLRKALQKQGLNQEKIEQLMKKMAACKSANNKCSQLSQAMAACGASELSGDELAELAEQLSELEALQMDMESMQAALDEISKCIGGLGEGMCEGLGCKGAFQEGDSSRFGKGTGGPGKGFGPRDTAADDNNAYEKTRLKNKTNQGPVIASWYFQGEQIKGEAQRDYTEVMQAARDIAAEAISENEIPRRYEETVKKYFGQMESESDVNSSSSTSSTDETTNTTQSL